MNSYPYIQQVNSNGNQDSQGYIGYPVLYPQQINNNVQNSNYVYPVLLPPPTYNVIYPNVNHVIQPSAPPSYTQYLNDSNSTYQDSMNYHSQPSEEMVPLNSSAPYYLNQSQNSSIKKHEDSQKKLNPKSSKSSLPEKTMFSTSPIDTTKNLDPSHEAFSMLQKKCKKCNKFYTEDQDELFNCWFHPGRYGSIYKSMMGAGNYMAWSCCKADQREVGCKNGKHLECKVTTEAMRQFTQASIESQKTKKPNSGQLSSSLPDNLIDFDDIKMKENEKDKEINQNMRRFLDLKEFKPSLSFETKLIRNETTKEEYITHNVSFKDTLSGLSIKYGVNVDEIKSINKLIKDEDIWTRFQILIPYTGQKIEQMNDSQKKKCRVDMKNRLIKRFRKTFTNVNDNEAKYYLKNQSWNYDDAVKEYKDDLEWEKTNPKRPTSISKLYK